MTYRFEDEFWVRRARSAVFDFFSEARNLEKITPPWLRFEILSAGDIPMRVGTRIDYRLRLHGIAMRWQTEIAVWDPPREFVDVQRRGPYRLWRHTHRFVEAQGGTTCRDEVEYAVPGGSLIHRLFVQRDVKAIFAYRREAITRLFPATAGETAPAAHNGADE